MSISNSCSGWFYDDGLAMKIWDFDTANERLSMMHGKTVDLVKQTIECGVVTLLSDLGETTCSFDMPFPSTSLGALRLSGHSTYGTWSPEINSLRSSSDVTLDDRLMLESHLRDSLPVTNNTPWSNFGSMEKVFH